MYRLVRPNLADAPTVLTSRQFETARIHRPRWAIFNQLGIDTYKESEIWHTHRDETGLHHYGGFFHFIGTIESGRDVMIKMNGYGTYDFEMIDEHFEWGLTAETALVPEGFAGFPVTQFEFATRIPWVINATEPD